MRSEVSLPNFNAVAAMLTGAKVFELGGWTIHELDAVNSTNLVAGTLPVWHALRAETQTAGRGRFERPWISDRGGLWLSAVVPAPSVASAKEGLPLVAGLAVCTALTEFGIKALRLRWPNDVLVHDRKLAGVLVDQFVPDRFVIGIGLNVNNRPEVHDVKLRNHTARLAESLQSIPPLTKIIEVMLAWLHRLIVELNDHGFVSMQPRINMLWGKSRRVELALDSAAVCGVFSGVDEHGRLLLCDDAGAIVAYNAAQVRHLQEIE
ncbi:MAG TPA: biotin--[acetyl-CoA-carboxylase] ligase [Candidatus Limnocylindrales bacterium]|nr:biotin--[acetyl-CoA-carboxylase] ligase [Candidatus Limnocylindrales bacterium]